MKARTGFLAGMASMLLAAALLSGGCARIGIGMKISTATLQGVEDDYRQARQQTAATEEAVVGIIDSPDPDLGQAFKYFSANKSMMEQIGGRLLAHADGMFYRGTYYFVESGKSLEACAFPRTGRTDDLRSIDLGEDFDAISGAGGQVKRAYRAFQFDIEKIQDHLAYHLNQTGIETIDQIFGKAQVDSKSLQEALDQAIDALEQAKTTLAQKASKQQPAPAPAPQR